MKANRFAKNDEGVSAVIGVILMVAITVILAAVIAAFVFGMVGNVNQKKTPTITLKRIDATDVQATVQDLGGAISITDWVVSTPSGTTSTWTNNATAVDTADALMVGGNINIGAVPSSSHVVITADVDGTQSVITDTTI
jgi:flagellin-like protein